MISHNGVTTSLRIYCLLTLLRYFSLLRLVGFYAIFPFTYDEIWRCCSGSRRTGPVLSPAHPTPEVAPEFSARDCCGYEAELFTWQRLGLMGKLIPQDPTPPHPSDGPRVCSLKTSVPGSFSTWWRLGSLLAWHLFRGVAMLLLTIIQIFLFVLFWCHAQGLHLALLSGITTGGLGGQRGVLGIKPGVAECSARP